MQPLADGSYDALVVDVDADARAGDDARVELVLVSGARKGEVVVVRGQVPGRSAVDLLGLPVTLVVADGEPHVVLDG